MKKHCGNCEYVAESRDERFCPVCGGELREIDRVTAEWGGGNSEFEGKASAFSTAGSVQPDFGEAESSERESEMRFVRVMCAKKRWFVLAFVGLLLDFIYGIGVFLCLPVAILASRDSLWLYKMRGKLSAQLVWAMTVGYIGALLGAIFFILMI
ncbi:MAG: hypothetical protein IJY62_01480 [Clostridia bacterium]|nr:hypothetical protein [Clostridia bacterium]